MSRVGPSTAAILSTLEPPVTVALVFLTFGEALGVVQLLGALAVLSAAVIVNLPGRTPSSLRVMARIVSVNVGTPRQISVRRGRPLMSAIVKAPVEGRVRVEGVNLAGDDQADRRVHGGPDKAVYAYAREDADWWEDVLGVEIANGDVRREPDHSRASTSAAP